MNEILNLLPVKGFDHEMETGVCRCMGRLPFNGSL